MISRIEIALVGTRSGNAASLVPHWAGHRRQLTERSPCVVLHRLDALAHLAQVGAIGQEQLQHALRHHVQRCGALPEPRIEHAGRGL